MAKGSGALTTVAAKTAGAGKHFDGGGLYLEVLASGSRVWRLKYRHAGKESRATFGHFPEVGLAEARTRAAKARALLRDGIAPNAAKAEAAETAKRQAQGMFPVVAAAWLAFRKPDWSADTFRQATYIVNTYLAPALRRESIATLASRAGAAALQKIPPSLAVKARGYLGQIVAYAIREGLRDDGRLLSLRGALRKAERGHIPAAIDPADVRRVLLALDAYPSPVTKAALGVAMLSAQRPGNVATMEWAELDLERAEWSIPAAKMKTRTAHLVPLPRQAVALLQTMQPYTAGRQFVFPPLARQKTPHLHRDALSGALRRMGLQGLHAAHGFRGMFRTVARERLRIDADVLEAQLAHAKRDHIQKAYDRTSFVRERTLAMQRWADYLDRLRKEEPKVVPFKRTA